MMVLMMVKSLKRPSRAMHCELVSELPFTDSPPISIFVSFSSQDVIFAKILRNFYVIFA